MVFFGVLVGAIVVHEMGHALAMHRCGVRIKAFLIGIPVPYLTFSFTTRRLERFFGDGFIFKISPILLGGGVVPHENGEARMERELSYSDYAYICGMGPLSNILAITTVCAATFIYLAIVRKNSGLIFPESGIALSYWGLAGAMTASTLAFVTFRKFVCAIILPVLGLFLFFNFVQTISAEMIHRMWDSGNFAYAGKEAASVTGIGKLVEFWVLINLALFGFNIFPLFPLDGGRIVNRIINPRSEWLAKSFRVASGISVAVLIAFLLGADINKLF